MVKAKKYVAIRDFPTGFPQRSDFEIVEENLPALQDGEILVKTEWISVDPYLRVIPTVLGVKAPYDQTGYQVGIVEQSKNNDYPVGTRVVSHKGWRDYTVIDPSRKGEGFGDMFYKLPDILGLSPSLAVGALGMPGVTAYHGFLELCKPKSKETVVVTVAAGAVGSLVGQIAKIKGCRVIGFAGSDKKVAFLEEKLGFDKAFNYKTVNASTVLKEAAPNGIDCYFDNVGGELSSIIMSQMNHFGRVAVCGSISVYNEDIIQLPKATVLQPAFIFNQLKVEGFNVLRWNQDEWLEAITRLAYWVKTGQLKAPEYITEGFDKVYDAFIGMLTGENLGKAVVKV